MVVVVEVDLSVEEQVMFVEDSAIDKLSVAEGIVVDMAESIVTDSVGDMVEQMIVDIAEVVVE